MNNKIAKSFIFVLVLSATFGLYGQNLMLKAKSGSAEAQYELATQYYKGIGQLQNYSLHGTRKQPNKITWHLAMLLQQCTNKAWAVHKTNAWHSLTICRRQKEDTLPLNFVWHKCWTKE